MQFFHNKITLKHPTPNALVYHSNYVLQILWENQSFDIPFKAS